MANRVKKNAKANTPKDNELLIPYMDHWELWRLGGPGGAQKIAANQNISALNLVNNPTLLIPQQYLNTIDLWILTQDQALLDDMVHLQLENRGVFANLDEIPIYEYRPLGQDQSRTLTLTTTLDPSFPEEWALSAFQKFDTAIHYFPFSPNQWTIWREMNRFVAVLTNDEQVIYAQALSVRTLDADFAAELRCISLQLVSDDISPDNVGITFWSPIKPEEKQVIEQALSLPIQETQRPLPIAPKFSFNLMPSGVRIKQALNKRFSRYRNIGILLGTLYIIGTLAFGGYLYTQKQEVDQSKTAIIKNRPIVNDIRESLDLWDQLQPVVDKELHPLYVLNTITNALPKEGVRITKFSQRLFATTIEGDAKNSGLASAYIAKLNSKNYFPDYKWAGNQPRQTPQRTWSFKQNASHPDAPVEE